MSTILPHLPMMCPEVFILERALKTWGVISPREYQMYRTQLDVRLVEDTVCLCQFHYYWKGGTIKVVDQYGEEVLILHDGPWSYVDRTARPRREKMKIHQQGRR